MRYKYGLQSCEIFNKYKDLKSEIDATMDKYNRKNVRKH